MTTLLHNMLINPNSITLITTYPLRLLSVTGRQCVGNAIKEEKGKVFILYVNYYFLPI